ncbi:MAG: aminopeptidase [Chloroflexi bacterium]|nr:aminopeptidase [Chloroflexota bacterium]
MWDARVDELARILVHYSTRVQPGETALIRGGVAATPLLLACYREVLRAGGLPVLWPDLDDAQRLLLSEGGEAHLDFLPRAQVVAVEDAQCVIRVDAPTNARALSQTDPARMVRLAKTVRPLRELVLRRRWVLCQYPTEALAQEADMALADFADFLFGATNRDWSAVRDFHQRLKARLEAGRELRIVGPDTDLTLGIAGRTWIPASGEHNMPDGEVFSAPLEDQVNGVIAYDFPAIHAGREVEGIRLVFRDGAVVEATARKNEAYLIQTLDADAGARRLGEVGIGTNERITRFSKSILFDEKIGGTAHLAVGMAYRETGGVNESSIHWDMIKDLRQGGALYLDGQLLQEHGRWLLES